MTVDYKEDIMFDVRKFLWKELVDTNIFNPDEYCHDEMNGEIIPILPVQQSPELNQFFSGKKHLVYDKIGIAYEDNWAICCEQLLFTIYAPEVSEIAEIRNLMTDLFRRMDDSARDINYSGVISKKFKFYSIYIADISPTGPSDELKGFFSAEVVLEIKYSRILDPLGRFN